MPPLLQGALIESPLRVEQTVPRAWVHKRSLDNVFVTEIRACADNRFICAARLPTAHRFFNDAGRHPQNDIVFYTELGCQASLAVCHAFLNVGGDDAFIFEGSHAALCEDAWKVGHEDGEAVTIEIRVQDIISRKSNAVTRLVTELTMWIGARLVFRGTGVFTIQPSSLFERVRRLSAGRTAAALFDGSPGEIEPRASLVPRVTGDNVAISPPRRGRANGVVASVVVDRRHPYFFDRHCDYVPSTLLLEACAQLASSSFLATTGIEPLGVSDCTASFTQFVERGVPAEVTAHVGLWSRADRVPPAVFLNILQQDTLCGTATMHLTVPAGR
jgi:2-oxo-3-(phosphooxy)propyl 3-oxoalkanoate synthase